MNIIDPYKKWRTATSILVITFFCLHYYYLYFVTFNEGVTRTPFFATALKILTTSAFYAIFFDFKNKHPKFTTINIAILMAILILLIKAIFLPINDMVFVNFFVLLLPYFLFQPKIKDTAASAFFPTLIFILVVQITVDFIIKSANYSIWDNKAFIGGFGNPSTFGLICNIAIAYLLSRKKILYYLPIIFLIEYGICQSKSLASIGVLIIIHLLYIWNQDKALSMLKAVAMLLASLFVIFNNIEGHLTYKACSAIYMANQKLAIFDNLLSATWICPEKISNIIDVGTTSASVSGRIAMYKNLWHGFSLAPATTFFIGLTNIFYNAADSQFVTFAGSFGILLCCTILYHMINPYFHGSIYKSQLLSRSIGVVLICYTLSNRIFEYYPVFFIFLLTFSLLKTENSQRENQTIDNQVKNKYISKIHF